jgi:cytoskeletal protein CcmA (bactofilin family)
MADPKNKDANERKTLVEEGTHFKGTLSSHCPVEVKGKIEGEVTAPAMTVSETGAVHGVVKVGTLCSQGELAGEFDADIVQLSGRVRDNTVVRAKSLEVKLEPKGAKMQVIFGECTLDVGEQPSKDAAIEEALRAGKPEKRPAATIEAPAAAKEAALKEAAFKEAAFKEASPKETPAKEKEETSIATEAAAEGRRGKERDAAKQSTERSRSVPPPVKEDAKNGAVDANTATLAE